MLGQGEYMKYQAHTSGSLIFFPFLMVSRVGSSKVKGKIFEDEVGENSRSFKMQTFKKNRSKMR
jgi:hypothetical protein